MNGRIFSQALCSLQGKDLRIIHVLCCDTGIIDLLGSKIKDLLPGDTNNFIHKLEYKAEALQCRPDAELQLEIVLELAKRVDLRGSHLSTEKELEEFSAQVISLAERRMTEQNQRYKQHKEDTGEEETILTMVLFQVHELFEQAAKELDKASPAEKAEFGNKVEHFIKAMPEDKQELVKQRLGVEQLTNDMLQRIIATGGASIVFAAIVEVSGFAFYTTATSLLASFAGFFGATLSFGAYTTLTSFIAVLANPLFILLLAGGGGYLLTRSQNRRLQDTMLPILILQITLPALHVLNEPDPTALYSPLLAEWSHKYSCYQSLKDQIRELEETSTGLAQQIVSLKEDIRSKEQMIVRYSTDIDNTTNGLKLKLSSSALEEVQVSPFFATYATRYNGLAREAAIIKYGQPPKESGMLGWIRNQVKSVSNAMDLAEVQRKQNELLDKLAVEVLGGVQEWGQEERESVRLLKQNVQMLRQDNVKLDRLKAEKEAEQERIRTMLADLRKEQKAAERRTYGLEHI